MGSPVCTGSLLTSTFLCLWFLLRHNTATLTAILSTMIIPNPTPITLAMGPMLLLNRFCSLPSSSLSSTSTSISTSTSTLEPAVGSGLVEGLLGRVASEEPVAEGMVVVLVSMVALVVGLVSMVELVVSMVVELVSMVELVVGLVSIVALVVGSVSMVELVVLVAGDVVSSQVTEWIYN